MTRKEANAFKEIEDKLTEAGNIIKKHENGTVDENSYGESLFHANVLILLARCDVGHQLFLDRQGGHLL